MRRSCLWRCPFGTPHLLLVTVSTHSIRCRWVVGEASPIFAAFSLTAVSEMRPSLTIHLLSCCLVAWPRVAPAQSPAEPSSPPAAYSVGAAYDSAHACLVVFGGYLGGRYVGDTWEWNGVTWRRSALAGPSARNSPALVYDERRGRVLLFGGDARPIGDLGDTWERVGEAWRQLRVPGPPPRTTHVMVYDSRRDRVVLFGGVAAGQGLGDTWEFDGERWSQVAADGPTPRGLYAMAYDAARGRTVLFGGTSAPRPDAPSLGDTWEWDGQHWTQIDVPGPSPRDHTQMAYDAVRRVIVLHGGGLDEQSSETWKYDGRAWTRADVSGPPRRYAKMTFDPRTRSILLYGGFAREPSNELWRLGDSSWQRIFP